MSIEIFVVDNAHAAHEAGFRGGEHPANSDVKAWWPGMGADRLRGRRFSRVVWALKHSPGTFSTHDIVALTIASEALRTRLDPGGVWIDLSR